MTGAHAGPAGGPAAARAWAVDTDPLARVVLGALVLACFAAFFITQRLKHTPTAVQKFQLAGAFSPFPSGHVKQEPISFKLARADDVTVAIINTSGSVVATLVHDHPVARYKQFSLRWNGRRGDAQGAATQRTPGGRTVLLPRNRGAIAPAGEYRVRVSLRSQGLTISSPRSFTLVARDRDVTVSTATALPSAGAVAAALAGAIVVIALLALLMRRREDALPLLVVLALPFRLPIAADGRTVNLLIPLYLVVAAGTIVYLLPRLLARARCPAGGAPLPPAADDGGVRQARMGEVAYWASPRGLRRLLFAAIALYALQTLYSSDHAKAAENIAFFYVPFALLFLLLEDVDWTRELLLRCLAVAVALAVVFAGIGFIEYERKTLFLNPKVVAANQYDNYFRVNSLFFDPSIYGRFLALVMIAVSTCVLSGRAAVSARVRRRDILLGAGLLAWLLGGLITSFSQSSIAALLLGLAVLAAYCWSVRGTLYVSAAALALAAAIVLLAPAGLHFGLKGSSGSTSNATSGRTKLISGGLALFAKRPLEGYGSGSFEVEYKRHNSSADAENATSASHTIPVTVAAEQGIVGLALYAALLLSAFVVLFRGAGRSPPRIAIAACFAALVLHTWTYADFLEDPFTWALLAIGCALAREDGRGASRRF